MVLPARVVAILSVYLPLRSVFLGFRTILSLPFVSFVEAFTIVLPERVTVSLSFVASVVARSPVALQDTVSRLPFPLALHLSLNGFGLTGVGTGVGVGVGAGGGVVVGVLPVVASRISFGVLPPLVKSNRPSSEPAPASNEESPIWPRLKSSSMNFRIDACSVCV